MLYKAIHKPSKTFDWASFNEFVEEFRNESDRAAVVLGAAKLDQLLCQLLQRRLIPSTTSSDELLENDGPLATFSARINACYRLGFIDREHARSLHIIRKIRNSFAHEISGCTLKTGGHRDRVKELEAPFLHYRQYKEFYEHYFKGKDGPEHIFRAVLAIMVGRLQNAVVNILPIDTNEDKPLTLTGAFWVRIIEDN